jgi:hypothetical protein
MNDKRPAPLTIDEKMLADYPELAVLTLDLPDSDGVPMDNARERLQMNLILDVLDQHWKDQRFYDQAGGQLALTSDEVAEGRAEAERARAEAERTRAETAEAEVARLRAELAQLRGENQ